MEINWGTVWSIVIAFLILGVISAIAATMIPRRT